MSRTSKTGVTFNARLSVRDFFLLLSLLCNGFNVYWCNQHDRDINQLKQKTTISEVKK